MFYYKDMEFETKGVYEPAEDSALLLRIIESLDIDGKTLLDMGTGSGVQAIVAAKQGALVTAVDINPDAVKIAKYNADSNNVEIKVRRSNLFGSVRGKFDYIVFNSPYLPVNDIVKMKETWSGGENLEILESFIAKSKNHLNEDGSIFLLISSITGLKEIEDMAKSYGYSSKIKDQEKIDFEMLYVLELKAE